MIVANVTLDSAAVDAVINQLPKSIFRAQRSAISTTTTWAKKEINSKMAAETGINPRVFKRFRVKSRRFRESGKVWLGYSEVKAAYVGKLTQEPAGAWAGDFYFPGGFIATMRSGHTGIFKNKSSGTGIVEQVVNLNIGVKVGEEVANQAAEQLRLRFSAKLLQFQRELN